MKFLKSSLEQERAYKGPYTDPQKLTIWAGFKLGSSWSGDVEFKQLPSEAEFNQAAKEVQHKLELKLKATAA